MLGSKWYFVDRLDLNFGSVKYTHSFVEARNFPTGITVTRSIRSYLIIQFYASDQSMFDYATLAMRAVRGAVRVDS